VSLTIASGKLYVKFGRKFVPVECTVEQVDALTADRDRLAAELAKAGPSCDRCQSAHCCSVVGDTTPPLCVTDPEGSLPLWMPWTNEDVRKRLDAVYAQVDAKDAELLAMREALKAVWPYIKDDDGLTSNHPWYQVAIDKVRAALAEPTGRVA
jgi:hypothetical protein